MSSSRLIIPENMLTLLDVMRFATTLMTQHKCYFGHGTDNALDEAVALVLGTLELPHDLHVNFFDAKLAPQELTKLDEILHARVSKRIPLPYLLNKAWFMGLPFYVTPDVLIPRSPIAEEINRQFSPWIKNPEEVSNILDLCCGSGCIGIACAYSFPDAQVTVSDISPAAIQIAQKNISDHHLDEVVTPVLSDLFENLQGQVFDIIVTNPPYVPNSEMQTLPAEYLHEPVLALEAPDEGLAIVRRILRDAPQHLSDEGILILEVGNTQVAMEEMFPDLAMTWILFNAGGHGVCVIDAAELQRYAPYLK